MTYRMYGALAASVGVLALMLGAGETFAGSGTHKGPSATAHPKFRPGGSHALRHHRKSFAGPFLPVAGGYFYQPNSESAPAVREPASRDIRYTYTYDVPWDWAHRYPPAVTPSDRPYVSSCPTETVTVIASDGAEDTVNITRCY